MEIERMEGERESLYEPLMMSSSLKSKPFNSNQKFLQILGTSPMSLGERKTRGEDEGAVVIICIGFTAAGNIKRPPR